jgi:MoaA/NifB/PqqE/SkfB family radical SAM enzyme
MDFIKNLEKYRTGKNVIFALLRAKVSGKRVPARVFLQLTKYCNMNCRHCWAYQEDYKDDIRCEISTNGLLVDQKIKDLKKSITFVSVLMGIKNQMT